MNNQIENLLKKISGPCVILAGAGTGKTHTIVEKIKYLAQNNIHPPEKIVCMTFSNEAANNLLSRVRKSLNEEKKEPIIKTFHAFSADLLKKYGEKISIQEDFKVLDPDQAKVVLHSNFKISPHLCHKYIASIGTAKDLGIKIKDLELYLQDKLKNYQDTDLEKRLENLQFELQTLHLKNTYSKKSALSAEIKKLDSLMKQKKFLNSWKAYEKIKIKKNYQDYSDLNNNALKLLQSFPEISSKFDYIIVDEFQDTNKVQLDLLTYLATSKNITIVGDLNQSIYRFRGAYKENFNEFKKIFNVQKEDIFNLDKSYRSSSKILRAAHQLILNNYQNKEDCFPVFSFQDREGENIQVYELKNGKEEARKVIELIEDELQSGTPQEEICIMCRTHQQARIIKNLLEIKKIEYCAVNKSSLLKNKSIKTVIDYLTILEKLKNRKKGGEQAWWDLIYHLNFEESDLIKIGQYIKQNKNAENLSALFLTSLPGFELSQSGKLASKILIERIKRLIPSTEKPIEEIVADIYNLTGLITTNQKKEEKATTLNLNKFYEVAKEQGTIHNSNLTSFIHYLEILNTLNIEINSPELEKSGVRLMTSHATKGLEYKTVIITNLAHKRFPMIKFSGDSLIPLALNPELKELKNLDEEEAEYFIQEYERTNQLFDERRLCYVSFTRAKEKLILTHAENYANKEFPPSQFLEEISYKKNPDLSLFVDSNELYTEPGLKPKISALSFSPYSKNFEQQLSDLAKKPLQPPAIKKNITFSPSSLLLFDACQKKYEYKYIYNMPEEKAVNWEVLQLGSFIHLVLEKGVKNNLNSLKDFLDLAKELQAEEDWNNIDLNEVILMIKVFFERHKNKFNENSKTEQVLPLESEGINFIGYADRIDFSPNGLEIIDYKTGKSQIPLKNRNWQLGYYALAASALGKVKRINLETLRTPQPLEFELDEKGNALPTNSPRMQGFNIYEVKQELVETAKSILKAYKKGFTPCPIEKGCPFL